jgi:hypothetical protein
VYRALSPEYNKPENIVSTQKKAGNSIELPAFFLLNLPVTGRVRRGENRLTGTKGGCGTLTGLRGKAL